MGQGWRRLTETARQKWGLTVEKNFQPTSNSRNEAMFKEATKFANHLRQVETDLKSWQKEVEGGFGNLRTIMLSPLPRVYEKGHTGEATCVEEPTLIGPDVQVERLTAAAKELKARLDQEVIQPIKQWMSAYRIIQERMVRLEQLRLELDSRRRTVHELQGRLTRITSTLGSSRSKGEADLEATRKTKEHKENKTNHTAEQYKDFEDMVYNSLFTLIKDTSVLREYAGAAIVIMRECFDEAYNAFDPGNLGQSTAGLPPMFDHNKPIFTDKYAEMDAAPGGLPYSDIGDSAGQLYQQQTDPYAVQPEAYAAAADPYQYDLQPPASHYSPSQQGQQQQGQYSEHNPYYQPQQHY